VELLRLEKFGEWYTAQAAVDGTPCVPFHFHASERERFPTEESLMAFIERQARMLIEQYGDARCPRRTGLEEN